ncbi:2-dehydropantoate 2-reductase [Derxia gummosa]|uniref:2-dehydropantoate 2-reductase n=1 Tax=Derxia gummosa DSM 723 TaxID=1121388 RepID=A0A8B6X423_9BURK|nr:2-dehydropantoate 2-reductase [Derxia gummosa]
MKIAIVGAGAIGGLIGTRLAAAGHEVGALARGATLAALRAHGWRLETAAGRVTAPVAGASDRAADLGAQDLVVIALKATALGAVVPTLGPLIGPHTLILPAMNGVPWWFCAGLPGFDAPLASVDAGGAISAALPVGQVIGCVVHASASVDAPGLVRHRMGQGLIVGEAAGGRSARAQALADVLAAAGFDVTHSASVRRDVWYKLWGNMTMNPVSAITGATIDRVLGDPLVRAFCSAAMDEAAAIGARIGCAIDQSADDRHAVTARLGAFRTSMLQDVDAGRPIELDAIVGAVREIGARLGIATPATDAIFGLARVFAQARGLYAPPAA